MTVDKFLFEFASLRAKTKTVWGFDMDSRIRTGDEHCPLTWLAEAKGCFCHHAGHYERAAKFLGLSDRAMAAIMNAADGYSRRMDLRRRLVAACGLQTADTSPGTPT